MCCNVARFGNFPEIYDKNFWIGKMPGAGQKLLDRAGIVDFNRRLQQKLPGIIVDLSTVTSLPENEELMLLLDQYDELFEAPLYVNGKLLETSDRNRLNDAKNSREAGKYGLKFAIATERLHLRSFPTTEFGCSKPDDFPVIDRFQETHAEPGQPMLVYHESADRNWCFVQIFNYSGWAEKRKIAFFAEKEWREYYRYYNDDFLLVTGKRLYLSENYVSEYRPLVFTMGARLPLWYGEKTDNVDMQSACCAYVAAIPRRQEDGSGVIVPVLVPAGSDVNRGWLEYSAVNIISQAFKMLGERYGWGGMYESWDCSGMIMACYLSFGFMLPRNCAVAEQVAALTKKLDFAMINDIALRNSILSKLLPGSPVFSDGHVMMYLGLHAGSHYVIHSTSGSDENGKALNCVLVSSLDTRMPGRKTLTERVFAAGEY